MINSVFEDCHPIFPPLGNEAGIDGIEMWRARLPDGSERILPMISVRTIHNDEINERHEGGEDAFDVIEEYTTWFWVNDRASFAAAFRAARMISKGGKIFAADLPPRTLFYLHDIDGKPVEAVVDCSVHHLPEAV